MATTIDFKEIEEVLKESYSGSPFPVADLSSIERCYAERYNKPLDYTSFGVTNIQELLSKLLEQEKVLLIRNPESKEMCVMSSWAKYSKQPRYLQYIVEELFCKHGGEIAFSSFEYFYMETFKKKWNSLDFGVTNLDVLCNVLKHIVEVEVNSSGEKVMKVAKTYISGLAAVTRDIEEILETCPRGIPVSKLSFIECMYQLRYSKSLDYSPFGVANIGELLSKLGDKKKLAVKQIENGDDYVMSLGFAESQNKGILKCVVEKLLNLYGGEIPFCYFGDFFEHRFKVDWDPLDYGMTDLEQLSDVLKDIVMVEENSSGERVIKAVNKGSSRQAASNLGKRKINE